MSWYTKLVQFYVGEKAQDITTIRTFCVCQPAIKVFPSPLSFVYKRTVCVSSDSVSACGLSLTCPLRCQVREVWSYGTLTAWRRTKNSAHRWRVQIDFNTPFSFSFSLFFTHILSDSVLVTCNKTGWKPLNKEHLSAMNCNLFQVSEKGLLLCEQAMEESSEKEWMILTAHCRLAVIISEPISRCVLSQVTLYNNCLFERQLQYKVHFNLWYWYFIASSTSLTSSTSLPSCCLMANKLPGYITV